METKRTAVAWGFLIVGVVMTTFPATASPVVNPNPPPTEKEKISSVMKSNKPDNQQQSQGLTSAKNPKTPGRTQSQGKASKTMLIPESKAEITDPRPMQPGLPGVSSSRPSSARTPPRGQKNAGPPPGERGKGPRVLTPHFPGLAGVGRLGMGGSAEGEAGKVGGGREEAGGVMGTGSDVAQLQQLRGSDSTDANLRELMAAPIDTYRPQIGGQKKLTFARGRLEENLRKGGGGGGVRGDEATVSSDSSSLTFDRPSGFALNDVPPLAMAEYLMLTGDFNGFDDALADIVAIRMMAPEEAEVYRDSVRLAYDSLLRQEAAADNEYQEADDGLRGGIQPFLPPLAIEYPDYSYYGNQALDNGRGGPFNPAKYYGPGRPEDKLEEVLQQMLESIASSYTVPGSEKGESYKSSSSGIKTSSSSGIKTSSSSSTTLEDQLKTLDQSAEKQTKWKNGGQKGGTGKGGGAGKGKGTEGKGGGGKGGGKSRKQDAKSVDAEKELKSVASEMPPKKTKEANSTKSRRPSSKDQASP